MFKVKNIPVVTVTVFIVTLVLTMNGFNNDQTSSVNTFNTNDVLAIFSHADWGHFLMNMVPFVIFGVAAEVLSIGRKWLYSMPLVVSILGTVIYGEVANMYTVGASGWTSAIPFISVFIGIIYAYENRQYEERYIGIWVANISAIFAFAPFVIELVLVNDNNYINSGQVNHSTHIFGMLIGLTLVFIAVANVIVRWIQSNN
jgi:membrane associated rhomboid family serine protease